MTNMISPKILYISSGNPLKGPGAIGMTHYQQLKKAGYDVDMLTLYRVNGFPDIMYIKEKITRWDRIKKKIRKIVGVEVSEKPPYLFFYKNETVPPVPVSMVLNKIRKKYDLVMIFAWKDMMSFQTVDAIYEKIHPVFFFLSPDFSHMSGGCHFTSGCERYKIGCGCCPAFNSKDENDFTHLNVLFRKKIYDKIKPIVWGNSYMLSFYNESFLLKNVEKASNISAIDTDKYHPIEKSIVRKKYSIDINKKFIIAFGCQDLTDQRKGISYLLKALNIFNSHLTSSEKNNILIISIGKNFDRVKEEIPFDSMGLGYVPTDKLSEFYSMADVFVCPSVDDAGPSMVAQSIACGTPVVGFKMGAMLDHVLGKGTGYCANLKDHCDLALGIEQFYRMEKTEYNNISEHCRNYIVTSNSVDRKIKKWLELYEKRRMR